MMRFAEMKMALELAKGRGCGPSLGVRQSSVRISSGLRTGKER